MMTEDFINAIRKAIDRIDEANSYVEDAVWEADEHADEMGVSSQQLWDCQDAIETVMDMLKEIIGEE